MNVNEPHGSGINDGFLAPYKVVRIDLDKNLTGWRPNRGMVDKHGIEIEDRIYNLRDFDRNLVLEKRTDLVARKISEFLKQTNRFDKTIVFCDSVDELRGIAPAVHRIFVDARAQVMEETLGNLSAFYAMFPGNGKFNVFPMWLAKDHHARLSICSPLKTGFVRR